MRNQIAWFAACACPILSLLFLLAAQDAPKSLSGDIIRSDSARHIDFTQIIKDLDGKPLPINIEGKLPSVATLGQVAKDALVNNLQEDAQLSGSAKFDHWTLALKVYPNKSDVVLTAEEVATIKERIGKAFGPVVVGPAWTMLDPASKKEMKEGSK
jgi:hypothetical protein